LVLGHSILPHNHGENEHSSDQITKAKHLSIAEILKLSLAHNLGVNHLEEFQNGKNVELTNEKSCLFFIIPDLEDYQTLTILIPQQVEDLTEPDTSIRFVCLNVPLRGPPTLS